MMKKSNLVVGYHGGQLQILHSLLQFPNMICKQLIENLLVGNKRYKIPLFCLLDNHHVRHVWTNHFRNSGHFKLSRIKLFMWVIEKHASEENFWVDRIIYWTIRDTTIMWK